MGQINVNKQRKSKLAAETLFGVCLIGAILSLMISIIIVTNFLWSDNKFYDDQIVVLMGVILFLIGIVLAIIGLSIKGAQSLSQTKRAKEEFAKQQAAQLQK